MAKELAIAYAEPGTAIHLGGLPITISGAVENLISEFALQQDISPDELHIVQAEPLKVGGKYYVLATVKTPMQDESYLVKIGPSGDGTYGIAGVFIPGEA